MALTAQNWTLASYTNSTWTDLVVASAPTIIKGLVIGVGSTNAVVGIRIVDSGGTALAVLTPGETLTANLGYVADLPTLTLENSQKLQVNASVAGCTFSAHGAG